MQIGTGKFQAGLLIELKDPSSRTLELEDSIWAAVEKANSLSLHKNQLQKDYITFAETDKPFIRTDKGTVKRRATLALYADYIERFYDSRDDEEIVDTITIDTSSIESIEKSVRQILGSLSPAILETPSDMDLFSLGLDSLLVFRAIRTIRSALRLHDQLAPRHLYANPTIAKFSAALAKLVAQMRNTNGTNADNLVDDEYAKMKQMIEKHKARLSFRLNPLDYVNYNHYMGLTFFFELRKDVSFSETFSNLQQGLCRTMQLIPALGGKIMECSDQEIGYKKGEMRVTIPPLPSSNDSDSTLGNATTTPRQLAYKDLSQILPTFEELRRGGFRPSAYKDELVLCGNPWPPLPADILIAQANFVEGGCILAANFHHCCFDGIGVMVALRVWAESCRYLQGDTSATCGWLDPESFNHSLPEILYEQEGYARPASQVGPGVWGFLPFERPQESSGPQTNGTTGSGEAKLTQKETLPPAPVFPRKFTWPPSPAQETLSTTMFLISGKNVEKLRQEVMADPEVQGTAPSVSDIVQAFFWRSAIRARYRVATELRGKTFGPNDTSILELPVDGRPYFSSLLPSSYMGSMLIFNRPSMPTRTLCSPETSIGRIASLLREAAARITPSLVHDAFTLLKSLPDYEGFSIACVGLTGMHALISNLMLFQTSEISFGGKFFADGGFPATMQPQIERGHKRFRFLVIYPMRKDGGVELVLGTNPEELEMFQKDEDFMKYATLVDSC